MKNMWSSFESKVENCGAFDRSGGGFIEIVQQRKCNE